MFALTFYGDDAGKTDENDYVVAGGCVETVAQWERFCPDWQLRLASVGLPYFTLATSLPAMTSTVVGIQKNARRSENGYY